MQPSPCLQLIPTQSLVLPGRQHENTPYLGSSGLDDKLVDRCGCNNEAFTHLWRPRVQSLSRRGRGSIAAQCMLSAANFLELCLWAPGRRSLSHVVPTPLAAIAAGRLIRRSTRRAVFRHFVIATTADWYRPVSAAVSAIPDTTLIRLVSARFRCRVPVSV